MSGLVKSGKSRDAMRLFYGLLRERAVEAHEITVVSALAACADIGAFDATRWVHEYAARSGIEVNVYVGTALVWSMLMPSAGASRPQGRCLTR